MLLQAALNGDFTKERHQAIPELLDELVRDAVDCVAAGAGSIHLHPRDSHGKEQLDASVVDGVVRAVRDACGVPVGVTTGAWIEPDLARRLELIRSWTAPDFTSVNISEEGSLEVMRLLLEIGVGIEAGVWTVEDAEMLGESGLGNRTTRILVEPGEMQVGKNTGAALEIVDKIHQTLDRFGVSVPRLQHADGAVTWVVLEDSIRRGIDTRVGLEDTIFEPDGSRTSGNAALIRAARRLGAGS
ncbi:MAG: 3-keto-5-aminohexanoate cleavage protein [Nitrolancea sp.]